MTIKDGDIRLLESKVMTDDANGGGGPTGNVIPWGKSNGVFEDITEVDRAGGDVSIRQVHAAVQTPTTEPLMDTNIIVSAVPNDPNVSITIAPCGVFARRTEIAAAIAAYLIPGTEWGGYLLENHVQGQGSIMIFHRPGTPAPTIGRTLILVYNEGQSSQVLQYVRVLRAETETLQFSYSSGGGYTDYTASVTTCEITPRLRSAFPGSPPNRSYAADPSKTRIRDTTVADAASFYGAQSLTAAAQLGESMLRVASIYTQLVPNSRTETAALDQRPAGVRQLVLATSPREIRVPNAPHTRRIKVGQENRSFSWVAILKPFPAPNTLVVSFQVMGVWYTASDNGQGELTGSAVGTVNYANGSVSVTLPALPDVSSSIIFQWGEASAFVNRSSATGWRLPEHAMRLPHQGIKPGSLVIKWTSGGVLRTATDNGQGDLQGAATGEINYASAALLLRPQFMIDAGGQFSIEYDYAVVINKNVLVNLDAGGYGVITLDTIPAPGTVSVGWITVRNLSASSGASSGGTSVSKNGGSGKFSYLPQVPPAPAPVITSRVPLSDGSTTGKYMAQGGTRASGGAVYIEVGATSSPEGNHYVPPDVDGVVWTDAEYTAGVKSIGGVEYRRWGA
ncbi:hypothetical protein [Delftia acidovorans]|uniref:hypothetical protein n=1 Tax=Delftia acidovorans TaxID=80866 RepID=UPI002FDD8D6B